MSWDISIMKLPRAFRSVAEIPDDQELLDLGSRWCMSACVQSLPRPLRARSCA